MESELRRNRTVLIVLAAVLALVLAVPLTITMITSVAFNNIRMVYDAAPLKCEDADVGLVPSEPLWVQPEILTYHHAIDGSRETRCTLTFIVVNDGRTSVQIPTLGAQGSGFLLELVHVNPNGSGEVYEPTPGSISQAMDIIGLSPLEGGQSAQYSIIFETGPGLHESAECTSMGINVPLVTLKKLGRERVVQPPDEQYIAFTIGDFDECGWEDEE